MTRPALILSYRPKASIALDVLLGALETLPAERRPEIVLAHGKEATLRAVQRAESDGADAIVAWTFYSPDFGARAEELQWLRAQAPAAPALHAAGGPHASAEPRAVLEAGFDLAAVGEGERIVLDLADALMEKKDPREVAGVASIAGGRYKSNGSGARIELDDYPPFAVEHGRLTPMEITRGCIYACSFCQTPFLFKARFRHRSIGNVRRWTRRFRAMGGRYIRFLTPTALSYGSQTEAPDLAAVEALLAAVREELGPDASLYFGTFPSEIRPEHVSAEALALLKRYASNRNLVVGAQSGSDRVLAEAKRGHSREDVVRAVRLCGEAGFLANVDFLFGLPGEQDDDVEASLALAETLASLGARIHAHTFMPLPGTPTRGAAPGRISAAAQLRIDRLTAAGRAYGQWREQIAIAEQLAAARLLRSGER